MCMNAQNWGGSKDFIENNNKIMEALVQHDTDATIVDE